MTQWRMHTGVFGIGEEWGHKVVAPGDEGHEWGVSQIERACGKPDESCLCVCSAKMDKTA